MLRCRLQSQGLLVSQWHSLPQGTGTFPAAYLGASSLCVRCVAMLVLPPQKLQMQCNIPNQKRTSSCWHIKLLNFKNQDVRNRSSHIVYSLACMLLWHWIVCNRNSKKLPHGIIIQNFKSRLTCDAICPTSAGGRHGKSEPRSVGVLSNAHGITLLLQRTKAQEPQLSMCFDVGSRVKVFLSPSGTLCPKARGLSPQHIWEQAPCVSAAWPCLSCPPKSCKCYATFQIRNVQAAADILNCWTSRIRTSEIEAVTSCTRWRACCFDTGLLATATVKSYHMASSSKTSSQNWLAMPSPSNICRREAWKEWAPFSWRSFKRSWHNFAAAKDQSPRTTTQHVLRCRLQSQGLLVSQWHSLPQGTGTFPAAYLGASSLCVRCVAMLVLPPKKLQMLCNLPNQKRTSSCWHIKLLNLNSLACMLLWHWIVCNRNSKKPPHGIIIRNFKSKLSNICRREAWKEWAPFSWRSFKRSWHNFAAAKDQSPRTTTQHVLRCRLQSQGLLVSQWHSLPKGTGTFPAAYLGASSLCVRCVAMLVLPPKKLQMLWDLPNQKRTSSCWHIKLLNFKNQDVRNRSSHIVYSLACMLLWHWIVCNRNSKKLPHGTIIRNFKSKLSNICRREAWKEWAPFSWRSFKRSWHNFAAAKDQSPRTTTQHVLRCRLQSQGLLVSQWHSLPKGTGTFPAAYLGASSLCVRCVAMLVLPPQKLQMQCNIPNQKRTSSCWHIKLLNFKNQDVRNRSSHIVYSLARMLLRHWIACNRNRKKLPRGIIIQNVKSKLTCDAISVQHLQEGGMERVSPVQLAFFQTLMA